MSILINHNSDKLVYRRTKSVINRDVLVYVV